MANLNEHVRDYLVAQGIVRKPTDSASSAPPLWLEPVGGEAFDPGERSGVEDDPRCVLSLFASSGIPPSPMEGFRRRRVVDLWWCVTAAPIAFDHEARVRAALVDRFGWDMAGLRVQQSNEARALTRVGWQDGIFRYNASYEFETLASDL